MTETPHDAYVRHRQAWRAEFEVWLAERELPGTPDTRLAPAVGICSGTPRNAADELLLGAAP